MTNLTGKQSKIFYGWWILIAVSVISAYASGVVFYGFTAILEPIADEFGWNYAQISVSASIRGFQTGFLVFIIGFIIDKWGPRKLLFSGIIVLGIGLFLLGYINSLFAFYAIFVLISVGTSACGMLVVMTVVGHWFSRRMSTATGIATGLSAVGGLLVPLITRLIDTLEWRDAMRVMGLGAWVILIPLTFVIRHKPEQYGYLPDGDTVKETTFHETPEPVPSNEPEIGVKEAMKSRAFWLITIGFTCHVVIILSVTTHIMPYLSSVGIDRSTSSLVTSAMAIISILGRFSFGWFGDRFDKRWLTGFGLAMTCISLPFLMYAGENVWLLVPFSFFFGIGFGGPVPMTSALLRDYFGRYRLGTILGVTMGLMMIGNMLGPPLTGWVYDNYGSYNGAWFAYIFVVIAGIISFMITPKAAGTGSR